MTTTRRSSGASVSPAELLSKVGHEDLNMLEAIAKACPNVMSPEWLRGFFREIWLTRLGLSGCYRLVDSVSVLKLSGEDRSGLGSAIVTLLSLYAERGTTSGPFRLHPELRQTCATAGTWRVFIGQPFHLGHPIVPTSDGSGRPSEN